MAPSDRPNDRRAWLEFGVRLHKEAESFLNDPGRSGNYYAFPRLDIVRHRLDAEIALLEFDRRGK